MSNAFGNWFVATFALFIGLAHIAYWQMARRERREIERRRRARWAGLNVHGLAE